MTAERLSEIEFEVDHEELVMLLAAPDQRDPREITDPIAIYGTRPPEPDLAGTATSSAQLALR